MLGKPENHKGVEQHTVTAWPYICYTSTNGLSKQQRPGHL